MGRALISRLRMGQFVLAATKFSLWVSKQGLPCVAFSLHVPVPLFACTAVHRKISPLPRAVINNHALPQH